MRTLCLLLASGIAMNMGLAAGPTPLNYLDDLKVMQEKVDVDFTPGISFLKKSQGVKKLFQFVFDPSNSDFFGKGHMIQRVVISDFGESHDMNEYLQLYGDTILYPFDGHLELQLRNAFSRFESENQKIKDTTSELKWQLSELDIRRSQRGLYGLSSPNLAFSKYLENFLTLIQREKFTQRIESIDQIVISEEYSPFAKTRVFLTTTAPIGVQEKSTLTITFGTDDLQWDDFSMGQIDFLEDLLDISVIKGFTTVGYPGLTSAQIVSSVSELNLFLTPEMVGRLALLKVKRFELSRRWEHEDELLKGSTLILGQTRAEMKQAIDLLLN